MGIKTDIYLKSRSAVDFAIECQRDPTLKGLPSRICDAAMVKAWQKMKGEPAEKDGGFDLNALEKIGNPDQYTDKELRYVLDKVIPWSMRLKGNLNLKRAYK